MRIPKQTPPVPISDYSIRYTTAPTVGISTSDCADGTLQVWFPDGTTTSIPNIVPCCYSYPDCDPCGRNWDNYVGEHFTPQCGPNNSKKCIWQESC